MLASHVGQFGKVFRAVMKRGSEPISVAVKTAKKSSTNHAEFLREMNIMSQMVHPNIVQLFGVIKDGKQHNRVKIVALYPSTYSSDKYSGV